MGIGKGWSSIVLLKGSNSKYQMVYFDFQMQCHNVTCETLASSAVREIAIVQSIILWHFLHIWFDRNIYNPNFFQMAQDYGLHVSNFPYWFSRRDIAWCITERFAYPQRLHHFGLGQVVLPTGGCQHSSTGVDMDLVLVKFQDGCQSTCEWQDGTSLFMHTISHHLLHLMLSAAFRLNKMNGHIGSVEGVHS